jgi:hypothetical protein
MSEMTRYQGLEHRSRVSRSVARYVRDCRITLYPTTAEFSELSRVLK